MSMVTRSNLTSFPCWTIQSARLVIINSILISNHPQQIQGEVILRGIHLLCTPWNCPEDITLKWLWVLCLHCHLLDQGNEDPKVAYTSKSTLVVVAQKEDKVEKISLCCYHPRVPMTLNKKRHWKQFISLLQCWWIWKKIKLRAVLWHSGALPQMTPLHWILWAQFHRWMTMYTTDNLLLIRVH
jgi:hypothetical protein